MNFVFLVDPLESLNLKKDTSYIMMQACLALGHRVFILYRGQISVAEGNVFLNIFEVLIESEETAKGDFPFKIKETTAVKANFADIILVRTDPPFNEGYLHDMWLLDLVAAEVLVVNHPRGIMAVNEKIWINRFADLVPPTLITRSKNQWEKFLGQQQKIIMKPTDGFGGSSVFAVSVNDANKNVIFETLTAGDKYVVCQKFIPEASLGDKRIHLLGGEVLGALRRSHSPEDHRNNFARGASAHVAELSEKEREMVRRIKPYLLELGLHYVGIDTIGDYFIELNVTSPTTVQEMNQLYHRDFHLEIIRYFEKLIKVFH